MQEPSERTVLGNFATTFRHEGVTTTFSHEGGVYRVRTDGPDGQLHDYPVRYVFGLYPLQQYLLDVGDGRLQALSVAWDCRAGRWFHLYQGQGIKPGDPLHWTGRGQNWNHMCADCHSTDVHKNYRDGKYATRYAEISVGCEACHGPGSEHARAGLGPLPVDLSPPPDHKFELDPATGSPRPVDPAYAFKEAQVCARCHARRHQFRDGWTPGEPLLDAYVPASLEDDLYFVDGQQKDEVFTYGSFLQSKMYRSGVACTDCHDAHTMRVKATGDSLCLSCHSSQRFAAPSHSHHQKVTCVECHAPTRTYMDVDPRHDHSFRVPRPDLSRALGTPNACTGCHQDKDADWAAAALREWFPHPLTPHFGTTLAAARRGDPAATQALLKLADDPLQPLIWRATALETLAGSSLLQDPDPWLRRLSIAAADPAEPQLQKMLKDPVRGVRIEAARALAASDVRELEEYLETLQRNADLPESQLNLGLVEQARGQVPKAVAAYREALRLDPGFVPAYANLADLLRATGNEAQSEAALREGLRRARPEERASLYYALGLWQVRQRQSKAALASLREAYRLAPADARLGLGYALALESSGQQAEAVKVLRHVLAGHPFDRDALTCLADWLKRSGRLSEAAIYAQRLKRLGP